MMKSKPSYTIKTVLELGMIRRPSKPSQQRGAVLVISLIILFVMTIIGITALNSTKLEQNMAGNFQSTARAFQLAESAIDEGMKNAEEATINSIYTGTPTSVSGYGEYTTTVSYIDQVETQASELPSSMANYVDTHWDIIGTGTIKTSGGDEITTRTIHQGIYMIGPSSSSP